MNDLPEELIYLIIENLEGEGDLALVNIAAWDNMSNFWKQKLSDLLKVRFERSREVNWKKMYEQANSNRKQNLSSLSMFYTERQSIPELKALASSGISCNEALIKACFDGWIEGVTILLEAVNVNPAYKDSLCLKWACRFGYTLIVFLLLRDGRADPSAENNNCLYWARRRNKHDVVKILMEDSRCTFGIECLVI